MIALPRYKVRLSTYLKDVAAESKRGLRSQWEKLEKQDRMRFDEKVWHEFRPMLQALGNGKCAYCECPLPMETSGGIDHFRPIRSVAETQNHPGYYWLAYDWDNLLPACAMCTRNKRDWFPLRNEAARAMGPKERLGSERPLLLDPSAKRFVPWHHLKFETKTGLMVPASIRGETTIKLVGLNREELVRARRQKVHAVEAALTKAYRKRAPVEATSLAVRQVMAEFTRSKAPYAGIARQVVEDFIEARVKTPRRLRMEREARELMQAMPTAHERAVTAAEDGPAAAARFAWVI